MRCEEKNKIMPEGIPLIRVQQKIGTRVIVDFLQLIYDLTKVIEVGFNFNIQVRDEVTEKEIKENIEKNVFSLKENTIVKLEEIYINIFELSKLLDLNFNELENERKVIEEKEGSFYKGKYVVFE